MTLVAVMNISEIEKNLESLIDSFSREEFIYDLLLAYGQPKNTITLLKKGKRNLSKRDDQIILKKKMFFQSADNDNLHSVIDELRHDTATMRHDPRFIIVTNYKTILAVDTKTQDTLDIEINKLPKHPDFFGPWAGREKYQNKDENIADVKAAEKMAKLYDEILKDNPATNEEELHELNVFLSRLLFCFFAEDTSIFDGNVFTNSINSNTQPDGSDLDEHLNKVFEVLNTPENQWDKYPEYLRVFKYVNGGLFGDEYNAPKFSARSRKMIIDCGELDWAAINPDIFGSMIQAVVHKDQRSGMGMHYTSVPNIMKVIEPLFLNELREEFEKHQDNESKLKALLKRIYHLRIFDPACGSGNFLIIAYKELRALEMDIFEQLVEISPSWAGDRTSVMSGIRLSQFYGIELDDFAHEVAILSLWLAEHQMNVLFEEVFGQTKPSLPLKEGGNIVRGNATRILWEDVCPKSDGYEVYVLGNPPYKGSKNQSDQEKEDLKYVLDGISTTKSLDYIACWFIKASQYIDKDSRFSFVSTNSLFQGTQVPLLWPYVLETGAEIYFAHKNFLWSNNAKNKAGVTCSIVGIRKANSQKKYLFENNRKKEAKRINPYLYDGRTVFIKNRANVLSALPRLQIGNEAYDCGHLTFLEEEKSEFVKQHPNSEKFFKKIVGSNELIKGFYRWCLWIEPSELSEAIEVEGINERIEKVRAYREKGGMNAKSCMDRPFQFRWVNRAKQSQIVLPVVSSQRREYIPMGFVDKETIIINSAQVIFDPEPFVFAILNSRIHMAWVKLVGGKLKTDYRYNAGLCYNTFPVPDISESQKEAITSHAYAVIAAREEYSEKTLAELYDPDKMPDDLRAAHHALDLAVEQCYRSKPFENDEQRLEHLFKLYEEMIEKEKSGEL